MVWENKDYRLEASRGADKREYHIALKKRVGKLWELRLSFVQASASDIAEMVKWYKLKFVKQGA